VVCDLHLSFHALKLPGEPGLTLTAYCAEPGTLSADSVAPLASWAATTVAAARRDERGAADQLVSRCRTKGSPGARTQMRSGFSTRSGNESGSALNGGKSGASTQPQWYSSNGVCG
jgi:hypothetical protein